MSSQTAYCLSSLRPSHARWPNRSLSPYLRSFFVAVIGPELDSENEQKDVTVGRAMRELAPEANPVMVGDRKHDIAAAREHDIRSIGVLWDIGSEEELRTAGADALAQTPTELATLLIPSL